MISSVTFLHAADLHLGAPFRGLRALSDKWADRLIKAIPEAFDRMIDTACTRKVDFVVIAGDIFDKSRASYADYLHFFKGLEKLNDTGIPVYLCTGNHDPYTSWQHDFFALPENTTMFSGEHPSFALYEKNGEAACVLGGRGYYNQTWSSEKDIAAGVTRIEAERALDACGLGRRAMQAPFGVGVLHTGLDIDPTKAPTDPNRLLNAGFDYWALGHIHMHSARPLDNPRIGFSGCIQGLDMKETGERGVYIVTLTQNAPNKVEFVPCASVVWQRVQVEVGDAETLSEMTDKIMRELFRLNGEAHCEEMCVRVTLTGETPLHSTLARPGVLEDMRKSLNESYTAFFCDALLDETRAPRDREALLAEGLFPAVLMQAADDLRESRDETIAYLQDEFLARNLQLPSSYAKRLDNLIESAEENTLDILSRGERP